jgi:hypothetical protein
VEPQGGTQGQHPIWTSPERAQEKSFEKLKILGMFLRPFRAGIHSVRDPEFRFAHPGLVSYAASRLSKRVCFPVRSFDLYLGRRIKRGTAAHLSILTAQRHAVSALPSRTPKILNPSHANHLSHLIARNRTPALYP